MTDLHPLLQEQLTALAEELAKRGLPEDIYDNHSFLQSMELPNQSSSYTELLEEHFNQFVAVSEIPYDKMPADDEIWYPPFLEGKNLRGQFNFSPDMQELLSHDLKEVDNL